MPNKTYNLELVKEHNRTTVIELLNSIGTTTRSEISNLTGLTRATVTNIINELKEINLIEEVGTIDGQIGRKRQLIKLKNDAFYVIGIEFGVNIIRAGVFDLSGKDIVFIEKEINSYGKAEDVVKNIIKVIDYLISKIEKDKDKLRGIGIVMPGLVDSQKRVLETAHPFPLLKDYPLAKHIEKHYKIKVWIENDANGAALGEKWFGHGKSLLNYSFVVADAGLGAGIIIDGKLYRGALNSAGEIGHTFITADFVPLENEGGLYKLVEKYDKPINILLKERKNNKEIEDLISQITQYVGIGIVNLVNIISPEAVIIGGRILECGYSVIREIKKFVGIYTFSTKTPKILVASKKEDAILVGGASIAIEQIVSEPYRFLLNRTNMYS